MDLSLDSEEGEPEDAHVTVPVADGNAETDVVSQNPHVPTTMIGASADGERIEGNSENPTPEEFEKDLGYALFDVEDDPPLADDASNGAQERLDDFNAGIASTIARPQPIVVESQPGPVTPPEARIALTESEAREALNNVLRNAQAGSAADAAIIEQLGGADFVSWALTGKRPGKKT
jgi:hypothetical protein